MTSPNLVKNKNETEIEQISVTTGDKDKNKKYIKQINIKSSMDERNKQNNYSKKRITIYNSV